MPNKSVLPELRRAVLASMKVVRLAQGGHSSISKVKSSDDTLVTITDKKSERAGFVKLNKIHGVKFKGEEGTSSGKGKLRGWFDGLDGTRAFSNGLATSTIIAGIYDQVNKRVVACVIGEPATGRVWETEETNLCYLRKGSSKKPVHVWEGDCDGQTTILLDLSHGFKRQGRQIITDWHVAQLFSALNSNVKIFMPGSNGLHQALVANGGERLVGSITLAMGGPWDVCGVRLVLNAGGVARAFERTSAGALREQDPLDPEAYDMLITGNNKDTADFLTRAVLRSCK